VNDELSNSVTLFAGCLAAAGAALGGIESQPPPAPRHIVDYAAKLYEEVRSRSTIVIAIPDLIKQGQS
jgi:hypothetical protein